MMDPVGLAGLLLLLAVMCGCLAVVRRRRLKTGQRQMWRQFKSSLPAWVRTTESIALIAIWGGLVLAIFTGVMRALGAAHMTHDLSQVTLLFSVTIGTWPLAALLANFISWMVPPIRRANKAAMAMHSGLSFRRANVELAALAVAALSFSFLMALIAYVRP
jgi:hypothetical protein